jgi:radical SAM protein with 4Fe4S-binding SPASM domain
MFNIHPKKKYQLFQQTENFCSVPWNLIYVDMNGKVKTCTKGSIVGDLNTQSIADILQNDFYKNLKKSILNDKKTDNCADCLQLQNDSSTGDKYSFLRNNYNTLFKKNDINYLDTSEFLLGGLDLHWSSVCDLKCITCWAGQSSSIAKEQGKPVQHTPQNVANDFIDYVSKNQSSLREIYLSGGEPTLISYNLHLLQKIEKRSDLLIRVNSNLMWSTDNKILKEILKFPNVLFTCSADGIGNKFEYIRRGASWKKFEENLLFLKDQSNVEVRINSVFFVLHSLNLIDTIQYFEDKFNINNFTINQCKMGHTYLRCRNLNDSAKDILRTRLQEALTYYSHNANLLGQITNCLREIDIFASEDYKWYLESIDTIEGSDWKKVFKELA